MITTGNHGARPEPAPDDLAAAKAALRRRARAARRALSPEARELAAEAVSARVLELVGELPSQATVLAYCAMAEELDPASTVAALRARGARIAFPRVCQGGALDLCEASESCEFAHGPFGILEPAAGAPLLAPEDVDIVLVPGVAFDRSGARLGLGGGYYDRLAPQLRHDCLTMGLAFDEQLMENVPRDESDAFVDAVITPSGTWAAKGRRSG